MAAFAAAGAGLHSPPTRAPRLGHGGEFIALERRERSRDQEAAADTVIFRLRLSADSR